MKYFGISTNEETLGKYLGKVDFSQVTQHLRNVLVAKQRRACCLQGLKQSTHHVIKFATENCYWTEFFGFGQLKREKSWKKYTESLFYIPGPDEQSKLVFSKLAQKSLPLKRKMYFLFRKTS